MSVGCRSRLPVRGAGPGARDARVFGPWYHAGWRAAAFGRPLAGGAPPGCTALSGAHSMNMSVALRAAGVGVATSLALALTVGWALLSPIPPPAWPACFIWVLPTGALAVN